MSSTIHKARQGTFYTVAEPKRPPTHQSTKHMDLGLIQLVVILAGGDLRKAIETKTPTYSTLSVRACEPMTAIAAPAFESSKEARGSTSKHAHRRRVIVGIKFHIGIVPGPHTVFSTLGTTGNGNFTKKGPKPQNNMRKGLRRAALRTSHRMVG